MLSNKIRAWLEKGVAPATYVVTGTSGNVGVLALMNGNPLLVVAGIVLIIAALVATVAYLKKSILFVQLGSMGSFAAWLYLCLYIITSGNAVSLTILGIPNVLLFAYFYLAAKTRRFWGLGFDSTES